MWEVATVPSHSAPMVVYCRSGRCRDAIPYGRRPSPIGVPSGLCQGRPYIHALVPIWPLESIYARRPVGQARPYRYGFWQREPAGSAASIMDAVDTPVASARQANTTAHRFAVTGGREEDELPVGIPRNRTARLRRRVEDKTNPSIRDTTLPLPVPLMRPPARAARGRDAMPLRAQELACVASQTILIRVGADRAESLRFREDRKKEEDAFALQFFQEVTGGAGEKGGCSGSQSPPVAPKVFFRPVNPNRRPPVPVYRTGNQWKPVEFKSKFK